MLKLPGNSRHDVRCDGALYRLGAVLLRQQPGMMLGPAGPGPPVIEVLTGSPFGAELLGGVTPFFSPPGWDPGIGLDAAIGLLGWTCRRSGGGPGADAAARLGEASQSRPLLAGPLEFGLLVHHPDSGTAIGSDHYVVVTGVEDGMVRFHDPHGHPYATLPTGDFLTAWRADSIGYTPRRTGRSRPGALAARSPWLLRDPGRRPPPVRRGDLPGVHRREHGRQHRRGAGAAGRRHADPLVAGDRSTLAQLLRRLAPTYEQLRASLPGGCGGLARWAGEEQAF